MRDTIQQTNHKQAKMFVANCTAEIVSAQNINKTQRFLRIVLLSLLLRPSASPRSRVQGTTGTAA